MSSSPSSNLRIACLLPSATDICIALGLSDYIVGITHECDLDHVIRSSSIHKYSYAKTNGNGNIKEEGEVRRNGGPCTSIEILTRSGLIQQSDHGHTVELTQAQIDLQVKKAAAASATTTQCSIQKSNDSSFSVNSGAMPLPTQSLKQTTSTTTLDTLQSNSIYPIIKSSFQKSRPNVILTQNLCNVCAPSPNEVYALLALDSTHSSSSSLQENTQVFSLDPQTLKDVAASFVTVATLCGVPERGERLRDMFLSQIDSIQEMVMKNMVNNNVLPHAKKKKKRVLCLEWLDPPYDAGHWIPDMIEAAGCTNISFTATTNAGTNSTSLDGPKRHKSKQITWEEIYQSDPDVILVTCCGFDTKRNVQDALTLSSKLCHLRACKEGRIYACNGDLHFARPGPQLIDGVKVIAQCVYGDNNDDSHQGLFNIQMLNLPSIMSICTKGQDGSTDKSVAMNDYEKIPIRNDTTNTHDDEKKGCDIIDIEDFVSVHIAACREGKLTYKDPSTGYQVFTELAHTQRGKCCGSGCRHCPYNHENVKDKASRIMQPAFLYEGTSSTQNNRTKSKSSDTATDNDKMTRTPRLLTSLKEANDTENKEIKVLFFSGGKDSYLTIRAILRQFQKCCNENIGDDSQSHPDLLLILLTTFDATSRIIAHQDIHINTIVQQAKHLELPLIGVPMHRGSKEPYVERMRLALNHIKTKLNKNVEHENRISSLIFGDLHLDHIRGWRENEMKQLRYPLSFPLWKVRYGDLLDDLDESGVQINISAVTLAQIGVKIGDKFDRQLSERLGKLGVDAFGENGEFHSVVKVWTVPRHQALGLA